MTLYDTYRMLCFAGHRHLLLLVSSSPQCRGSQGVPESNIRPKRLTAWLHAPGHELCQLITTTIRGSILTVMCSAAIAQAYAAGTIREQASCCTTVSMYLGMYFGVSVMLYHCAYVDTSWIYLNVL